MMLSIFLGAYLRFIYHWYSICLNLLPIFNWLLLLSSWVLRVVSIFWTQVIYPIYNFCFPNNFSHSVCLFMLSWMHFEDRVFWFWWSPAYLSYLFFLFPNNRFSSRILALAVGYILSLSIFIWCEIRAVVHFSCIWMHCSASSVAKMVHSWIALPLI